MEPPQLINNVHDSVWSVTTSHMHIDRRRFLALFGAGTAGIAGGTAIGPIGAAAGKQTAGSTNVDVERDVMVPMRDGVELATDVYRPADGDGPFPTLVNRTPYDKAASEPVGGVGPAVANGYAVVHQDARGRFASEGEWEPFFNEGEDGYDTIEWAADREWSTGDVGMYGNSYMGMTTWQAILEDPPSLVAAAPLITPTNYYANLQYMGGADNLGTSMFWTAFTSLSHVGRLDVSDAKANELRGELGALLGTFPDGADHLPTIDHPAFDDGVAPHWRDWHEHPTYDDYWQELDVLRRIDEVDVPVVHAGGWYDIFLKGHTSLYAAIEGRRPGRGRWGPHHGRGDAGRRGSHRGGRRNGKEWGERRGWQGHGGPPGNGWWGDGPDGAPHGRGSDVLRENQHMVIGPWTHGTFGTSNPAGEREFGENAAFDVGGALLWPWFDHWLGDGETLDSMPSVRYFQMGDDEWRTSETWPPRGVHRRPVFLDSDGDARSGDGDLTMRFPGPRSPPDTYEYDPLDPTPTRGGPLLMGGGQPAGVFDQRPVEERDDVLVYTSEPLEESVAIAGDVTATLYVESTAPDTDFVVKLVDVDPDGYAANVTEGALRVRYRDSFEEPTFIEPGTVYEIDVDVREVAHTFAAGHRIRLDVASSNFPKLDRNPNAAVPVAEATEADMQTASQTVYHDVRRPSRIVLPIQE